MVQIIPAAKQKYSFGSAVGQSFGEGLGEGLKESDDRRRQDRYREEEDQALKKRGIDLSGIRDPETRAAVISNDLKRGSKRRVAKDSKYLDTNPYNLRSGEGGEYQTERNLPSFLDNKVTRSPSKGEERDQSLIRDYPSPQTNQNRIQPEIQQRTPQNEFYGEQGSLPESSVQGGKRRIFDADELSRQAHEISRRSLETESPMDYRESLAYSTMRNNENKDFNREVDNQKTSRILAEDAYGKLAQDELKKYFPGTEIDNKAPPELEALFSRYGEEAAKRRSVTIRCKDSIGN